MDPGVATSDLAKEAALEAIARAGLTPADIGFIMVGHDHARHDVPEHGLQLQHKIGAHQRVGLRPGRGVLGVHLLAHAWRARWSRRAPTSTRWSIGADVMSSIIDYTDRATCVLFGDGAGAVVARAAPTTTRSASSTSRNEIDGSGGPALCMPAGGSRLPASHETVEQRLHYVKQDGQAVFKFAVRKTEEISRRLLAKNGLTADDVALFVSHQANRRIIESAAERLGLGHDKVVINIERFGNTTAATIPARAGRHDARRAG